MSAKEILARIAHDVGTLSPAPGREITIAVTRELFARLVPPEMPPYPPPGRYVTLFGCRVEPLPVRGLWWIVGYKETAEEIDT